MFKSLRALLPRWSPAHEHVALTEGYSGYEWLPEFNAFLADTELSRLLKVSLHSVESIGGALDPGFSLPLKEPQQRLWFLLLVSFSVQNNREALLTLADWAPTDSAALWCRNPPSCTECGSVRPHHQEYCPEKPFLTITVDED